MLICQNTLKYNYETPQSVNSDLQNGLREKLFISIFS